MPEKPEEMQPEAVADDELEGVTGGRVLEHQNSTSPLAGADGRPLDFPA
jgi:hypothetical protein